MCINFNFACRDNFLSIYVSSIVFTLIIPVLLTIELSSSFAEFVVKYTSPPSAINAPEFETKASNALLSTLSETKELPFRLIEYSSAPTRWIFAFYGDNRPFITYTIAGKDSISAIANIDSTHINNVRTGR